MSLCLRFIGTLIIATSVASSATAAGVNLVDFGSKAPVAVENLQTTAGEDYVLAGKNAKSTLLERDVRTLESSVTYDLRTQFRFEQFSNYEICLWMHVDGLPANSAGPNPFTNDTQAFFVHMDLLDSAGNNLYRTRAMRIVTRGWNELKFNLICDPPANEHVSPDFPVRRRAYHFDRTGEPNSIVSRVRLRFSENPDIGKIRLNSLELKTTDPCKVVLIFDDGYSSVLDTVRPKLQSLSLKASLAIIGAYLSDTPPVGHMGRQQTVSAYGATLADGSPIFDCLNHSYRHRPLHNTFLPWTIDQLVQEIRNGMDALTRNGLTRNEGHRFLVYPGGMADSQVFTAMDELGVHYARAGGFDGDPNGPTHSVKNKYWGHAYDTAAAENGINGYDPRESIEQFMDWIDEGVIEGQPRHIIWHDVSDSMKTYNTPNNWNSITWFNQAIDYIAQLRDEGLLEVVTLPEWYFSLDRLHKMNAVGY